MKTKTQWKRYARDWLSNNAIITGFNGLHGTSEALFLIDSLAQTFERIDRKARREQQSDTYYFHLGETI